MTNFAFVVSLTTALLTFLLVYYTDRSKTNASKLEFVDRMYASGIVSLLLNCETVSITFYTLGLARIGFCYYAKSIMAIVPEIIFFIAIIVLLALIAYVQYTHAQLAQQEQQSEQQKHQQQQQQLQEENTEASQQQQEYAAKVKEECETLAGRAVYVAGLSQNSVMRFLATSNDANNIAGHAFLVFGCFSTAFAIIAAYTLSNIAIHLSSFDTKQMEVAFATKMQPLVYFAHACYLFSFFSLVASITLMAHGCNYAAYGGVNMIIGTSSLAFLLCVCYWTYTCFWKAFALKTPTKQQISVAKRDAYQQWLEQQQQDVSRILAQVANIGSQATLASGFSYYQIVTFQTDVLTLPWLNTHLATLFLFASVICVTAGEGFVCALLMYIE